MGVIVVLLVGCGSAEPDPPTVADTEVDSEAPLPVVDLSLPPTADDPDPAVRAGAVAGFVECEFGVWAGGWTSDFGPLGDGADADGALQDMIESGALGLPDDRFVPVGRDRGRVLYTYDVDGATKAALVIADSAEVELDTENQWAVESFAACDPAEFDPSTDDRFGMTIWSDGNGDRVPTSTVSSFQGAEHCGWESTEVLRFEGTGYYSDPEQVLADFGLVAPFDDDAELPADAIDTGYTHDGRDLWLSADRSIAFVDVDGGVQAWPSSTEPIACG